MKDDYYYPFYALKVADKTFNFTKFSFIAVVVSDIKLPAVSRKRGKPRGSETSVIGIPKIRKTCGPLPFVKMSPREKEKGIQLL